MNEMDTAPWLVVVRSDPLYSVYPGPSSSVAVIALPAYACDSMCTTKTSVVWRERNHGACLPEPEEMAGTSVHPKWFDSVSSLLIPSISIESKILIFQAFALALDIIVLDRIRTRSNLPLILVRLLDETFIDGRSSSV